MRRRKVNREEKTNEEKKREWNQLWNEGKLGDHKHHRVGEVVPGCDHCLREALKAEHQRRKKDQG
jgi:hypothetical protein